MGALEGKVTIPKVGSVPKRTLVLVGGAAAAFVGYRYYVARSSTGDGTDPTASDFADGGLPPGVIGAVSPDNSYGSGDSGDSGGSDTSVPTTNSAWSQLAATQLSQSDTWSYTDIVTALGNYLSGVPLSAAQQAIVRAAIAIQGYPPVGSHVIVPGGDTGLIIAPTGLKVSTASTTATLSANAVAGAASYRAYRSGSATNVGSSSTPVITVSGLTPSTRYTFHMRAVSSSGAVGPASADVSATTAAAGSGGPIKVEPGPGAGHPVPRTLKAPTGFSVSTTRTTARLRSRRVSGATGYRAYRSGSDTNVGASSDPDITVGGLAPGHSYTFHMRATNDQGLGAPSRNITIKTKK